MTEEFCEKCEIQESPEIGRYVKAKDCIKAGETLLMEKPVLILATAGDKRCSNCFKFAQKYCGKCQISPLCLDCSQHSEFDCTTLAAMTDLQSEELKKHPECYGIVKCLLLSQNPEGQEGFQKILQLMSHLEKRRKTEIWQERNKTIVQPLMKSNLGNYLPMLSKKIDEEFLQHLCGILDVNTYEIRAPDMGSMSALYLKGSLLAHQCVANANVAIDEMYRIKIYANRDIEQEEMVTNCYTNVLLGTEERRHILQEGKYFHCLCTRCEDPTELGSHMSSFICAPCAGNNKEGYIVRQPNKKWQCLICQHTLRTEQVNTIIDKAKEEVFHAQDDLRRFEILLAKLSTILHRNHYIMVDIKQNIANILRSIIRNSLQRPGRRVYERKVRLCQELVMVLHIILPGISRLKAIALYELANASAELYRLRFGEKELAEEDLQSYLRQCEAMYKESIRMLLYEPPQTPEGELMRSMMGQLKDLKNDMQLLEKSLEAKV